jgi:chemotaxis response regulator CheB
LEYRGIHLTTVVFFLSADEDFYYGAKRGVESASGSAYSYRVERLTEMEEKLRSHNLSEHNSYSIIVVDVDTIASLPDKTSYQLSANLKNFANKYKSGIMSVSDRNDRAEILARAVSSQCVTFKRSELAYGGNNLKTALTKILNRESPPQPLPTAKPTILNKDSSPMSTFSGGTPMAGQLSSPTGRIIAIASSTGGTEVLDGLVRRLPSLSVPIVVVQHMPPAFTKFFANRLDSLNKDIKVVEASSTDIEYLHNGVMYIAPSSSHIRLVKAGRALGLECFHGPKMHGVIPAADILFDSIAPIMGNRVLGIVLTGMGMDGAKGLLDMFNAGARTIAQSKDTCVVHGMPRIAVEMGGAEMELPPDRILEEMIMFGR